MQVKVDIKKALTAALAVAAFVTPAAQADPPQLQLFEDQHAARLSDASDRGGSDALSRFLANDGRVGAISDASDRSEPGSRLRGYESFRAPQTPVSVVKPGDGVEWPAVVAGGALLALLAGFGIAAIVALRSRGRVAHS
jgi:hypothetical protein